ncbi:geraniol 8-hydroxylase-like [Senna tora]|uniref:Geraniol 8-hydroxylase-like n=1 Tax=Senna tora TaxID=362788 RepID=A0A834XGL3_9FABA|nr:geraniol 8-hydroxylase-like [Senna tora]
MDNYFTLLSLIISFLFASTYTLFFFIFHTPKNHQTLLPPGPPSYPIIGNIFQLNTQKLHQSLTNLSTTYGPIMTIKIGTITTIVISSPTLAKEALRKHDHALATRFVPHAVQALGHHESSVIFLPVSSPRWRTLRKFCATKIFSPHKIIRAEKVMEKMLGFVRECGFKGEAIDVGEAAFTTVLNALSNAFFSVDLAGYRSDCSHEFREVISCVTLEASKPNVADYLTFLRWFDPQGAMRRMRKYYEKLFRVFEGIVEERILQKKVGSELLHNPEKMNKAKEEIQQVFTKHQELIKDSDISKLPYLQAIIKETLRMHPAAPILVHKSEAEVEISGFRVPKEAQVLINVWAMGRDPSIWASPDVFLPERFMESSDERDFKGNIDFGFIPFGAGRRVCPGIPLAFRVIHTMVALLLHHFDWKLEDGQKPEDMDMREAYGITLYKVQGLRAMAIPIKE